MASCVTYLMTIKCTSCGKNCFQMSFSIHSNKAAHHLNTDVRFMGNHIIRDPREFLISHAS